MNPCKTASVSFKPDTIPDPEQPLNGTNTAIVWLICRRNNVTRTHDENMSHGT